MPDDAELLRRYAGNRDEAAFAELVQRHLGLVYHAALRQCGGDAHRAEDVAQTVFTDLARKAENLARRPVLAGWLYTSTRYAAAQAVRTEARRQAREQEVHAMNELFFPTHSDAGPAEEWERLRPVIDDALHALGDRDREAVLLRFFEGRAFAEVGAKLLLSEDAARMRVDRALEKLRAALVRRGITSTTAALGVALANQAAATVPVGVAASVTGAALVGAGAVSSGAAVVTFMSMTKLQVVIVGVVALASTAGLVVQANASAALRDELAGLHGRNQATVALRTENVRLASAASKAEAMRAQAGELAQLRAEAAELRGKLQAAAATRAAKTESTQKPVAHFTGQFFESNQVDQQPKPVSQARPLYPAELREAGVTGKAVVDFIVDADGAVRNATVLSAPHPAIGDSVLEAVSHWKFDPARKDGGAVAMHKQLPITFTLTEDRNSAAKTATPDGAKPPQNIFWF